MDLEWESRRGSGNGGEEVWPEEEWPSRGGVACG